jgi:flagellar hook-length control protein FliK
MTPSLDTVFQPAVLPDSTEQESTSRADSRREDGAGGPAFRDTFAAAHQRQRPSAPSAASATSATSAASAPGRRAIANDGPDTNAGERTHASAPKGALREIPLGRTATLLVAGEPPSEEDLLAFAREAGLPDSAVEALMLGKGLSSAPGAAWAPGGDTTTPLITPEEALLVAVEESGPLDAGAAAGAAAWAGGVALTNGLLAATVAPTTAPTTSPTMPTWLTGLGTAAPLQAMAAGAVGVQTVDAQAVDAQTVDAQGLLTPIRLRIPVLDAQSAAVWAARAEQGLEAKGVKLDPLVLQRIVFEKMADATPLPTTAERLASIQAADLGAAAPTDGPDLDRLAADVGGASPSRAAGGSLFSGQGDNGQGRQANQQLAQRFGDLLSQRLVQQISQGNWKVNMEVHPRALGEIQIELHWKGGELEASFRTSQLATRELLLDQLPRLRETLEKSGTDVASLTVGDSSRQKNGDEKGHNRNHDAQSAVQTGDVMSVEGGGDLSSQPVASDGRLDVLV